MKYIVTGGAGFIGSTLTDKLIKDGHEVVVIDNLSTGNKDRVNPLAQFLHFDIRDIRGKYLYHLKGADVLFHCAALARVQPSIEDPIRFNDVNVNGTITLLETMRLLGIPRIVYSGSSSVYGDTDIFPTHEDAPTNPLSPYGLQKLIGEQYCKIYTECYGIESVCLRYFNVYGENQPLEGAYKLVMGTFIQQKYNNKPMTIRGDGSQRRDFTYVGDVVRANMLAAEGKKVGNGEVINIGAGNNVSVQRLADMIGGRVEYIDPVQEPFQTLADNKKALKLLGWKPRVVLREWIKDYLKDIETG